MTFSQKLSIFFHPLNEGKEPKMANIFIKVIDAYKEVVVAYNCMSKMDYAEVMNAFSNFQNCFSQLKADVEQLNSNFLLKMGSTFHFDEGADEKGTHRQDKFEVLADELSQKLKTTYFWSERDGDDYYVIETEKVKIIIGSEINFHDDFRYHFMICPKDGGLKWFCRSIDQVIDYLKEFDLQ